jgi:hypothetical protein
MKQPIPLVEAIEKSRKQLGLPFAHNDDMIALGQGSGMKAVRARLMQEEIQAGGPSLLTQATFWDLTQKYQYDALMWEIPRIANALVISASYANIYVQQVVQPQTAYYQMSYADELFFYHIDTGIRLVSSGWDRLALLLDLAFQINLAANCNFHKVIDKLLAQIPTSPTLAALESYRQGDFQDLERRPPKGQGSGKGKGLRDEATHLLNPGGLGLVRLDDPRLPRLHLQLLPPDVQRPYCSRHLHQHNDKQDHPKRPLLWSVHMSCCG